MYVNTSEPRKQVISVTIKIVLAYAKKDKTGTIFIMHG